MDYFEKKVGEYLDKRLKEEKLLGLGVWYFLLTAFLLIFLFPFSLLVCWFLLGLETTKALLLVLFHDALKILYGLAMIGIPVVTLLVVAIFLFDLY